MQKSRTSSDTADTHGNIRRVIMRNVIHSIMLAAVAVFQIAVFASVFLGR
jgi:hypothetical protein